MNKRTIVNLIGAIALIAATIYGGSILGSGIKSSMRKEELRSQVSSFMENEAATPAGIEFVSSKELDTLQWYEFLQKWTEFENLDLVIHLSDEDAKRLDIPGNLSCDVGSYQALQKRIRQWLNGSENIAGCVQFGNDTLKIYALKHRDMNYCPGFERDASDLDYQRAVFSPAMPFRATEPNSFVLQHSANYSVLEESTEKGIAECYSQPDYDAPLIVKHKSNCFHRNTYCGRVREGLYFADEDPVTVEDVAASAMFFRMLATAEDPNSVKNDLCPSRTASIFRFSMIEEVLTNDTYRSYLSDLSKQRPSGSSSNFNEWLTEERSFIQGQFRSDPDRTICFVFPDGVEFIAEEEDESESVSPQIESYLNFPVFSATYYSEEEQGYLISGMFNRGLNLDQHSTLEKTLSKYLYGGVNAGYSGAKVYRKKAKRMSIILKKALTNNGRDARYSPTKNEKDFFRTVVGAGAYTPTIAEGQRFELTANANMSLVTKIYPNVLYSKARFSKVGNILEECEKNNYSCIIDGVIDRKSDAFEEFRDQPAFQPNQFQTQDPSYVGFFMKTDTSTKKRKCAQMLYQELAKQDMRKAVTDPVVSTLNLEENPGGKYEVRRFGLLPSTLLQEEMKDSDAKVSKYISERVDSDCSGQTIELAYYEDEPFEEAATRAKDMLDNLGIAKVKVKKIKDLRKDSADIIFSNEQLYTSHLSKSLISFVQQNEMLGRRGGDINAQDSSLTKEEAQCAMAYWLEWEKTIINGDPPWFQSRKSSCPSAELSIEGRNEQYLLAFEEMYQATSWAVLPLYYFKPWRISYNVKDEYWIK